MSVQSYNDTFFPGRWKDYFTEKNITEFKERWNSYLIKWGYEEDENW